MHIAAIVLSQVLAIVMAGSGLMKLIHAPRVVAMMADVNVTPAQMTLLGLVEIAATAGLFIGMWLPSLAIAAAVGVVLYFAGALVAHRRAHDRNVQGAVVFLVLAIATSALLIVAR